MEIPNLYQIFHKRKYVYCYPYPKVLDYIYSYFEKREI